MKKLTNIDDSVLYKAIEKWGSYAQIEMIEEECIELALAIHKLKRKRGDADQKIANVIDEIADVTIMIRQAHKLFDIDKINERIEFKMNRLNERIKEGLI